MAGPLAAAGALARGGIGMLGRGLGSNAFRIGAGGGLVGYSPFAFQGIEREMEAERRRRELEGAPRTFGSDIGAIWRGLTDPGEEGRSRLTQYFLGPETTGEAPPPAEAEPAPETEPDLPGLDWGAIAAGFVNGAGGTVPQVTVPTGMFQLYETPQEREALNRQLADLEARTLAGERALRAGWGEVQATNAAAAEKARGMVSEVGDVAAGYWEDAEQRALDLAAQRAAEAGQFEGRAAIDISPDEGVQPAVQFMQTQAPAERRLAESQQARLGEDLDWLAGMAGMQGEAYVSDLNRQAQSMAFNRATEHNQRVQDRINQERMLQAQMQMQAATTNASLAAQAQRDNAGDPYTQFNEDAMLALTMGDPSILVNKYGISPEQAQAAISRLTGGLQQLLELQD